jgi:signal peptidase I
MGRHSRESENTDRFIDQSSVEEPAQSEQPRQTEQRFHSANTGVLAGRVSPARVDSVNEKPADKTPGTEPSAGVGSAGVIRTDAEDKPEVSNRRAQKPSWGRRKKTVIREVVSYLFTIALALFLITALKLFIVDIYAVPTGSMSPTIAVNDRIIAEKISYHFTPIRQFDVVTFIDPINPERTLVKRVIAVGGQTVDLRDGYVFVDGTALNEPYTLNRPSYPLGTVGGREIRYPYLVPEGCIWVMGDNRTDSADSRYFGSIDVSSVSGRSILVAWPPEHFNGLSIERGR